MKQGLHDYKFIQGKVLPFSTDEDSKLIMKSIEINKKLELLGKLINQPHNYNTLIGKTEYENVQISSDFVEMCKKSYEIKTKQTEITSKIDSYKKMITKIETDQERLRNNIKSLENVKSDNLIER